MKGAFELICSQKIEVADIIKANQSSLLEVILQKDVAQKELGEFLQVALNSDNLEMANQIIAKITEQEFLSHALLEVTRMGRADIVEYLLSKVTYQEHLLGEWIKRAAFYKKAEIVEILSVKVTNQKYLGEALCRSDIKIFQILFPLVTEQKYIDKTLEFAIYAKDTEVVKALSPYISKELLGDVLNYNWINGEIKNLVEQRLREVDIPIMDKLMQKFETLQEDPADLAGAMPQNQTSQSNLFNEPYSSPKWLDDILSEI